MAAGIDFIRSQVPWMKDLSDEEVLAKTSEITGKSLPDAAAYIGYETPSSMMGKELYAGGNRYLGGFGHIGAAMGIPGAAEYAAQKERRAQALQGMSTAPHSFAEMKLGDSEKGFWPYAGQLAAGSLPYAAEAAGFTAADIATGGALTPAIAARYAARLGATAPRLLGGQALREGADFATRRAAAAAAQEAAPGLARTAMLPVATYPSSLGDTLGNQFEESGRYNLPSAMAAAVPYSALNVLGLEGAVTRGALPRLGIKGLEKNAFGRAASGALASGGSEAVGETGQEVTNQLARMGVNPNAGLFDPAALERYKESAIGGGILGGLPGTLHAFPNRAPLDKKRPANLLNPEQNPLDQNYPLDQYGPPVKPFTPEEYGEAIERQRGVPPTAPYVTPPGTAPFTPEEYEAGLVPRQPEITEPFDLRAQLEGLGPPGPPAAPVVPAGSTKPKAVANAARDTKTNAAAPPVDPKVQAITNTNMALRPHLPGDLTGKTEGQLRQKVRDLVGDPQTVEEAIATAQANLVTAIGKGSKGADRAERLIMFLNGIQGTPEAEQLDLEGWKAKLTADSAEAARVIALTKAKLGQQGQVQGAAQTLTPEQYAAQQQAEQEAKAQAAAERAAAEKAAADAAAAAAAPPPDKPQTPAEVEAYKAQVEPRLKEGLTEEEWQALKLTRGKRKQNTDEMTAEELEQEQVHERAAEAVAEESEEEDDEETGYGALRAISLVTGIPHTTLADRVRKAQAKVAANAAKLGLSEDAANELLNLQSSYDDASGSVMPATAWQGKERVNTTDATSAADDFQETAGYEPNLDTYEFSQDADDSKKDKGTVQRQAAPDAAEGEGADAAVEATQPAKFATGWTDKLRRNVEGATEEWEAGRADDDPTWDELIDSLQLQWVKGYVDSNEVAGQKFGKPKQEEQRAVEFQRQLGMRRAAVREGVKEYGLRQPDGETAAGEDDAGTEGGSGQEVGGVSGGLPKEGEERVSPAPAGEPKGAGSEASQKPESAGQAPAPTAEVIEEKKPAEAEKKPAEAEKKPAEAEKKPAEAKVVKKTTRKKEEAKTPAEPIKTSLELAEERWNELVSVWKVPELGAWSELSEEAQREFAASSKEHQNLRDAMLLKKKDEGSAPAAPKADRKTEQKAKAEAVKAAEGLTAADVKAGDTILYKGKPTLVRTVGEVTDGKMVMTLKTPTGILSVRYAPDDRIDRVAAAPEEQEAAAPAAPEKQEAAPEVPAPTQEKLETEVAKLPEDEQQQLADFYGTKVGSKKFFTKLSADVVKYANKGKDAVASAIRSIIAKVAAGILAVAVVFNPTVFNQNQALAYDLPAAVTTSVSVTTTVDIRAEVPAVARAKMSPRAQSVYEAMAPQAMESGKGFMIADKPMGMLHVFHADGSVMSQSVALYGKDAGDVEDKVSSLEGGKKITPAGTFTLMEYPDPEYTGGLIYALAETNRKGGVIAVHAVWLGDPKEQRQRRLDSASLADNKISYGCINTESDKFLKEVLPNGEELDGGPIFVLPDEVAKTAEMFPVKTATTTETTTQTSLPDNATTGGRPEDTPGERKQQQAQQRLVRRRLSLADELEAWAKKKWGERIAPNGKKIIDNFLRWFGDSVVLRDSGEPTVNFHGTVSDFDTFKNGWDAKLATALGFHFAVDPVVAHNITVNWAYSETKPGASVIPVYLKMEKPLVITGKGSDDTEVAKAVLRLAMTPEYLHQMLYVNGYKYNPAAAVSIMQKWAEGKKVHIGARDYTQNEFIEAYTNAALANYGDAQNATKAITSVVNKFVAESGYDGIVYQNTASMETRTAADKTAIIVFKPEQVKSAIGNNGNFDEREGNIRFSEKASRESEAEDEAAEYEAATEEAAEQLGATPVGQVGPVNNALLSQFAYHNADGTPGGVIVRLYDGDLILDGLAPSKAVVEDFFLEFDSPQVVSVHARGVPGSSSAVVSKYRHMLSVVKGVLKGESFKFIKFAEGTFSTADVRMLLRTVRDVANNAFPDSMAAVKELEIRRSTGATAGMAPRRIPAAVMARFSEKMARNEDTSGDTRKGATTVEHATSKLKQLFFSNQRFDQRVTIVKSVSDLDPDFVKKNQIGAHTQAYVHEENDEKGKPKPPHVYLIADNIDKGSELGVFLHEMGAHVGMENLIGKENLIQLKNKILDWVELNDKSPKSILAKLAYARMEDAAKRAEKRGQPFEDADFTQELIAYFVEEAVAHGINPTAMDSTTELGRWFRKLWAAAKIALRKMGLQRFDKLTPQDIVNLAYGAARLELEGTWHGTAAQYRKFDHGYMSTGEGGQAFAWGSYLAQRMGIGKGYWEGDVRRKSQRDEMHVTYDGKRITDADIIDDPVANARYHSGWWKAGFTLQEPEKMYDKLIKEAEERRDASTSREDETAHDDTAKFLTKARAALKDVETSKLRTTQEPGVKPEGALLRVDVNATDDELLDWDESLSKQPKVVQDALAKLAATSRQLDPNEIYEAYRVALYGIGMEAARKGDKQTEKLADKVQRHAETWSHTEATMMHSEKHTPLDQYMKGMAGIAGYKVFKAAQVQAERRLSAMALRPEQSAGGIYQDLARRTGDRIGGKKAVSLALGKLGVKGVKFLDAESRNKKATVNYTGPQHAHIPIIQQNMESLGLTFAEAKRQALEKTQRALDATQDESMQYTYRHSLERVGRANPAHYKVAKDERTRNLVIFDEDNIFRVYSQIAANPERVRFSEKVKPSATATASAKHIANLTAFEKKYRLGFMITEDIADLATHHGLPEVRDYVNAAKDREGTRVAYEKPVDGIADLYESLPQAERGTGEGSVNKFIHDATRSGNTNGINRLSASGQELVKKVFKHGAETLALKQKLIEEEVGREYAKRIAEETSDDEKAKLVKERDAFLKRFSKLVTVKNSDTYAPLKRFGDYVVSAKSPEYLQAEKDKDTKWLNENQSDPNHYQVHFADSQGEADALAADLKDVFVGGKTYAAARDADIRDHHDLFRAFPVLQRRLTEEFPTEGVSPMARIIRDLYLQALSENHARKTEMRRRNITGASTDMMRAFVTQGRADAAFLANLKHSDTVEDALQAVRKGTERDPRKLTPYQNEILQRHAASYETHSTTLTNRMKRTTSLWMLATNPTYYLQQLIQPWSMSLPVIAGRQGYFRTGRALSSAYADIKQLVFGTDLTEQIDWSKAPADVRDMLNVLSHNGAIDVSNAMDMGEWSTAGKSKAGAVWNRVDRRIRGLNTRVEALNRGATAIAAYRMELAKEGNKDAATKYAEAMVRQTHGSYDASNTPRYIQGPLGQVAGQFRRFQIIQISMIARLAHNAFKGSNAVEKGIARRALAYTLLHTGALGGVLGLPGAALITGLVARLFGPDDEPPDFEKLAREAIGDQAIADLLLKGVPAMLGVDFSSKLGMGQMLTIAPFADFPKDREGFEKYVFAALGPSVGLAAKAVDGLSLIYKGDMVRGTEQLLPTGFANVVKAGRIANQGVALRSGDTVLSPEELTLVDAMMQGVGAPTTTITHQQRLSATKYEFDTYYKDRTTELTRDYQRARKNGEATGDIMAEWMSLQEGRVRNGYTRQPVSLLIKSAQAQAKRERNTAGGVEFTKANRRFVQDQANL